jgi:hypothetical protein
VRSLKLVITSLVLFIILFCLRPCTVLTCRTELWINMIKNKTLKIISKNLLEQLMSWSMQELIYFGRYKFLMCIYGKMNKQFCTGRLNKGLLYLPAMLEDQPCRCWHFQQLVVSIFLFTKAYFLKFGNFLFWDLKFQHCWRKLLTFKMFTNH